MKIGELFVALGFKSDTTDLGKMESGLMGAKKGARGLQLAIAATAFATFKFVDSITKHSVGLKNFTVQTGLSARELEKWRYVAEMNDVSGQELVSTIKNIQKARADIQLGKGNIRPWQLLGIDPKENPFKILEKIRDRVKGLDPAIASSVLGEIGVGSNFLNILKASNIEFDEMNEKFILLESEQKSLLKLNRAFRDMMFGLRGVRNRLGAIGSERLIHVIKAIKNVGTLILDAAFAIDKYLDKYKALRVIAASVLTGLLVYFAPITAAVVALTVALDDLFVFLNGGDSVIGKFFEKIETLKDKLSFKSIGEAIVNTVSRGAESERKLMRNNSKGNLLSAIGITGKKSEAVTRNVPNVSNVGGSSNTSNMDVVINVNGSGSPSQTASVVKDTLQNQVNKAYFQTPVLGVQ